MRLIGLGIINATLLTLLQITLLAQVTSTKGEDVITGTVRETHGNVVEGIKVSAQLKGNADNPVTAMTDAQGQFHLTLPPGVYELFASDEARLYPDCRIRLFACSGESVSIKPGGALDPITLTVRQAGYIRGIVTDANGAGQIEKAYVLVRRADNYYRGFGTEVASTFKILVPAETGLTLVVSAWKYRLWTYREISSGDTTLRVAPGQELNLRISMVRVEK